MSGGGGRMGRRPPLTPVSPDPERVSVCHSGQSPPLHRLGVTGPVKIRFHSSSSPPTLPLPRPSRGPHQPRGPGPALAPPRLHGNVGRLTLGPDRPRPQVSVSPPSSLALGLSSLLRLYPHHSPPLTVFLVPSLALSVRHDPCPLLPRRCLRSVGFVGSPVPAPGVPHSSPVTRPSGPLIPGRGE